MQEKYNVFVRYLGDDEFKFVVKRIGEVSITREKPLYFYNADLDIIDNLRVLKRMLIEITIGAKPTGAFKIYDLDDYNRRENRLQDKRVVADRRGYETVSNEDIKSIMSSGTNGPIEEEPIKEEIKPEVIEEDNEVITGETVLKEKPKKTSKKKSTKKTSKK